MRGILSIRWMDVRFGCLIAAIVFYALFGSPTPNAPGVIEILIAALLISAAGISRLYNILNPQQVLPFWMAAGRALLLYGVGICLVNGVLRGHDAHYILRDVAPFLFFLLPLFLIDLFSQNAEYKIFLILALVCAGLAFSVRSIPEILGWWAPDLYKGELYYFANAPSLLFTALFVIGFGGQVFLKRFSVRAGLICLGCFALALVPLGAILFTFQRASIAVWGLGCLFLFGVGLVRTPGRMAILVLCILAVAAPFLSIFQNFIEVMVKKTVDVGLNMRSEEFTAAWREISGHPFSVLFGSGWGGTFESPAVASVRVNYTHSLLSAMVLKTGLIGLSLTLFYLGAMAYGLVKAARQHIVLAIALGGPLAIDSFLYASYKSLDFGLVLLLASVFISQNAFTLQVAPRRRVLYSNLYRRMRSETAP